MGVCASNLTEEEKEAAAHSKSISKGLKKDWENQSVKLLLLGTGESGKSTILKQMKILHQRGEGDGEAVGLTKEDREAQVAVIRSNVIDSCEHLLEAAETFGFPLEPATKDAETAISAVLELEGCDRALKYGEIAVHIAALWADSGIQKCLDRKSEFYLLDSAPYFLKKAATLAGEDYLPSDEDVLRARSITTGVVTVDFTLKEGSRELKLELVDVGGQRGERRRWIHCFEGVTAVMFIISLSDYNQTLWEDDTTNRMQESEKLFGDMLNNVFFRETPFIVFFNKVDLFSEKLKTVPLTMAYKDYVAPEGDEKAKEEHALNFIRDKFKATNLNKERNIYPYNTTATDTSLVKNVMGAVQTIIFRAILGEVF